ERLTERTHAGEVVLPLLWWPDVHAVHHDDRVTFRIGLGGEHETNREPVLLPSNVEVAVRPQDGLGLVKGPGHGATPGRLRHRVEPVLEARDDTEAAAATAPERPEQVRILVLCRAQDPPLGVHELSLEHVVARQPVPAAEQPIPAAEAVPSVADRRALPAR